MKNYGLLFVFSIFFLRCNKTEMFYPPSPPLMQAIDRESVFIDRTIKFLYFYVPEANRIFNYNYQSNEIRRQSMQLPYTRHSIGYYKGAPEVYVISARKNINILDGITLEMKDSIVVFDSNYSPMKSIEPAINDLMVIGNCDHRALILNRDTKRITSQIEDIDDYCLSLRTYVN